jgi:hypothetical protein
MTVNFPSTSSTVTALNGFFWATGTQIYQTFTTASNLASIDQLTMSFSASFNSLWSTLQWQAVVNGVAVGTFQMPPNYGGQVTGSRLMTPAFSFPAIPSATSGSGNYTLEMDLIVGATNGDGCVQLGYGTTTIASV